RPSLSSTLSPYTALFRSIVGHRLACRLLSDARLSRDSWEGQGKLASRGRAAADLGDDTAQERTRRLELAIAQERDRLPDRCRMRSEEHTSELQSRFDLVC